MLLGERLGRRHQRGLVAAPRPRAASRRARRRSCPSRPRPSAAAASASSRRGRRRSRRSRDCWSAVSSNGQRVAVAADQLARLAERRRAGLLARARRRRARPSWSTSSSSNASRSRAAPPRRGRAAGARRRSASARSGRPSSCAQPGGQRVGEPARRAAAPARRGSRSFAAETSSLARYTGTRPTVCRPVVPAARARSTLKPPAGARVAVQEELACPGRAARASQAWLNQIAVARPPCGVDDDASTIFRLRRRVGRTLDCARPCTRTVASCPARSAGEAGRLRPVEVGARDVLDEVARASRSRGAREPLGDLGPDARAASRPRAPDDPVGAIRGRLGPCQRSRPARGAES